jgi:mannose-6-phosphate isomerase-like protein (cupin superfamily)
MKNEKRPWGNFKQFTENEISTVKIINVEVGQNLSVQYHNKRSEFWVVLEGNPLITLGEKSELAKVGDEFFIEKKMIHSIGAPNDKVQILEISFGEFDENDIVRIKDFYGRI